MNENRDKLEALKEAADAIDGDAKKKLAALASQYIPDIIRTAVVVMNDTESRQRLNAAALLAEWATESGSGGGGNGANGGVRVLVVNGADLNQLSELQRQSELQKQEAKRRERG